MTPSQRQREHRWRSGMRAGIGFLLGLWFAGCAALAPTPAPIATREYPLGPTRADTLVVFLPGRGDRMEDFERRGLREILRASGVAADVVAVNAHLGYYYRRTVIDRLREDVLRPARAQGYRRIVVVGISLGGLGGLLIEREHPGTVDALVLLSPYVGDRADLFKTIAAAGGPAAWAAGRSERAGDVQEQLWTFLGQRSDRLPPTWLLTGESDRLLPGQRLLAGLLPPERVHIVPGGHDWATWRALWEEICRTSPVFAAERK